MTDEREIDIEPGPDPDLRAALIDAFGEQPVGVDWAAMQARARSAALFRLRARSRVAPWWEQARPWAAPGPAVRRARCRRGAGTGDGHPPRLVPDADARLGGRVERAHLSIAEAVAMPNANGALSVSVPVDDDWLWDATAAAHAAEGR